MKINPTQEDSKMRNWLMIIFLFLGVAQMEAQHSVSGAVTDAKNEPLVGVNIQEAGTTNGATTDAYGSYELTVQSSSATLIFSYIGFTTVEITLSGQNSLNVSMAGDVIQLGGINVVGSRNATRSATNSPVAIDIIDVSDLAIRYGKAELNQILQYAAPSFNATKQSGSDGADHIDPASLRGLGPDQTLVLINGKRRHQSSLVNVFGTRGRGNSGTDLNAIPAAAIKRIEVLRDGASAQYGSDAIAGVINVVLKDNSDGITVGITTGNYSTDVGGDYAQQIFDTQGEWEPALSNINGKDRGGVTIGDEDKSSDGNTVKIDLNYGANLGDNGGFVNVTTEYLSRARTLRPSFDWREGYGTAAVDGFNFMVNSAMPVGSNTEVYAFGGRNFRDTDAYAFTRGGFANGDNRAVPSLYPNGFTPRITSNIIDVSASMGVRHNMSNGWKVDFNNTYGKNNFHYYIRGTNNASLGGASPTDFDAGGHTLSQNTTSLDFSKYNSKIKSGFNLAFGLEFRTENFTIFAGEEGSYALYDTLGIALTNPATQIPAVDDSLDQLPSGSQGFPGYSPANVVDRSRTNFGFYLDAELNVTDALLLSGAVRQENYSDFGQTTNYKVAGRYSVSNSLSLRGSVSTGFRAPSLAQKHYNLVFNNIVAGESVRTLLASNTSTVAKAFGIGELTEETAANSSVGFTFNIGELSATVDAYSIAVKDRIVLTDNFDASALNVGAEDAQFFANGVDTKTTGVDIVLNYSKSVGNGNRLSVGLAGNMNTLEIEKINNGELNEFTFFGPFSQAYLEAAAPDYKFGLNLGFQTNKLNLAATFTSFSEVILQDFQWIDSPATTQAEADALFAVATDTYEAATTLDLSAGYSISNNLVLTVGANNLLNTYPTPQYDGWTDQGGFNDSIQMGSDGAYYFSSIGYKF